MSKHRNNQIIETFAAAFQSASIPREIATLTILVRNGMYLNQKPGYRAVRIRSTDTLKFLTIEANDNYIAVTHREGEKTYSKDFPTEGETNSWPIFPAITRWVDANVGTKEACIVAEQFVHGVRITPGPRLTRPFQ